MYIPKNFKMDDKEKIYEFMETHSFALVISQHKGLPYATHLPLVLDKKEGFLYGHFARANKQWEDIENQQVLIIFQGPHCYISPSWYETKQAVPTWNYAAVHVYGQMEIVEDGEELVRSLRELVEKYEAPDSSYQLSDLDAGYLEGMSRGIVGFKIKINEIQAKAKLSQNQPINRQELIINQLEKATDDNRTQIAELMKENIK